MILVLSQLCNKGIHYDHFLKKMTITIPFSHDLYDYRNRIELEIYPSPDIQAQLYTDFTTVQA